MVVVTIPSDIVAQSNVRLENPYFGSKDAFNDKSLQFYTVLMYQHFRDNSSEQNRILHIQNQQHQTVKKKSIENSNKTSIVNSNKTSVVNSNKTSIVNSNKTTNFPHLTK